MPRDDVAGIACRSREQALQFSEEDSPWQAVPRWVSFLIKCGYSWGDTVPGSRRVGVISMPCESAAAGLVALGAMCRRLTAEGASDVISHYQRIERLAINDAVEPFLRHKRHKGRFRLEEKDRTGVIWVRSEIANNSRSCSKRTKLTRFGILPSNAYDWHFDGEVPVQAADGAELPNRDFYEQLMDTSAPVQSNFSQSDSGICLAGRVAGESVSKGLFSGIRFQNHGVIVDLSRLLTVQGWSHGTTSRMAFFNTRTGQFDRNTGLTRLVVTDGDAAFLRVLDAAEFRSSDVLGVVLRTVERDRLESLGVKIAELAQWYSPDPEMQNNMSSVPPGITVLTFKRR